MNPKPSPRPQSLKVFAESPQEAMWTFYRGLETPESIKRLVGDWVPTGNFEASRDTIRQARDYFAAARASTMLTRPVLAYYGMVSLAKILLLFDQSSPMSMDNIELVERKGHGLKQTDGPPEAAFDLTAGELEITGDGKSTNLQPRGMFPTLATRVAGPASSRWLGTRLSVLTLLRCVPQIERPLVTSLGPSADYLGLGGAIHTDEHGGVAVHVDLDKPRLSSLEHVRERTPYLHADVSLSELPASIREPARASIRFRDAETAYASTVREEFNTEVFTLPPHLNGVRFDSILANYALMYTLSIVARYKPHRWAAILDGRSLSLLPVVEAVVANAERWWPNLLLNRLTRSWVRFAHPQYW